MSKILREQNQLQPVGKLGVLIPGMGAVATTFIAGVEAIRQGLSAPVGSLTQMGHIRLVSAQRVPRSSKSLSHFRT